MVDEQVHDSFRHLVSDRFADDVEIGRDEGTDEFGFQGLALVEFGIALRGLRLLISGGIIPLTETLTEK